jgi:hypothetical protein
MDWSKIKIILLISLIAVVAACSVGRVDMFNSTGEVLGNPAVGVDVNIGDGLITGESTPLTDTFSVVLHTKPLNNVTIGPIVSSNTAEVSVSPAGLLFTVDNWDTPQIVTVSGVDDGPVQDGLKTVIVDLGVTASADSEWNNLSPDNVIVYNLDDDTGAVSPTVVVITGDGLITKEDPVTPLSDTFSVVLNSVPAANVTLGPITSSDTGEVTVLPANLTFTLGNWSVPQVVTVTGVDDGIADDIQSIIVDLSTTSSTDALWDNLDPGDVTVHNMDDESTSPGVTVSAGSTMLVSENGTDSSFGIVLDSQPANNVSIDITVSDTTEGTITSPFAGSAGTITFTTANWNIPKIITVQGIDDLVEDGNQPFMVTLDPTVSADPVYSGTFDPADVSYSNVDDDNAGVTVNAGSTMLVSESGTTSAFEVVLNSQPTNDVTINVSTSDNTEGTITAPFAADSGTLTFTNGNWNIPQTVTVIGVDDLAADGNQAFMIVLGVTASADAIYSGTINPVDVNFTCVDNGGIPGVTVNSGSAMLVAESGTSSSFEVVLNSQPSVDVTINVSTGDFTEGTITAPFAADSGTLTFTNGNWNIPQTVTVAGVDDVVADGNQAFTIVLGLTASADAGYNGTIDPSDMMMTERLMCM